jgi:hypothetical protein
MVLIVRKEILAFVAHQGWGDVLEVSDGEKNVLIHKPGNKSDY